MLWRFQLWFPQEKKRFQLRIHGQEWSHAYEQHRSIIYFSLFVHLLTTLSSVVMWILALICEQLRCIGATTGVNLSLKLCCALNIAAWQVEPDEGCPTCRWNEGNYTPCFVDMWSRSNISVRRRRVVGVSLHVDLFPLHHLPNLLSSALLATQTKTIICTIKGNPTSCRLIHVWVE